jgi:hypothetical protein
MHGLTKKAHGFSRPVLAPGSKASPTDRIVRTPDYEAIFQHLLRLEKRIETLEKKRSLLPLKPTKPAL